MIGPGTRLNGAENPAKGFPMQPVTARNCGNGLSHHTVTNKSFSLLYIDNVTVGDSCDGS